MKTNALLAGLALSLTFVACQPDPIDSVETPGNNPGKPDGSNGGGPKNDSIYLFSRTRISWAPTDYKEVDYDEVGKPVRYTTQNLYVQGTGEVRKVIYDFIYTGSRLTQVEASNKSYVTYTYDGDKVSRTEEFSPAGKLIASRRYQYFPDNRLKRLDQTQGAVETAQTFAYDTKGNLIELVDLTKDPQTGTYRLELVTRYTNYDAYKNVSNLWAVYPFLPAVTFQINNPATVTQFIVGTDGAEQQIHQSRYAYQYNAKGAPIAHTQTDAGGSLTATYSYVNQ